MILDHKRFHSDNELPSKEQIFVFGSNLAGAHGLGAAKVARERYGAIPGAGQGLMNKCYAIATKDYKIKTLPLLVIREYVQEFVLFSRHRGDLNFYVTAIGCGLAGYTPEEIAPMFSQCSDNCTFSNRWYGYV